MLIGSDMWATGRRSGPAILPWWAGGPLVAAAMSGLGLAVGLNATAAAGGFVLAVIVAALLWGPRGAWPLPSCPSLG